MLLMMSSAAPILSHRQDSFEQSIISKLLIIAPQSDTCAGAPYPLECRTASQVLGPIFTSFVTYEIVSSAEMAALISLMAFETEDFKYHNNYYPGNPGQGSKSTYPMSRRVES